MFKKAKQVLSWLSVFWRCWLGDRKGIRSFKTSASKPIDIVYG